MFSVQSAGPWACRVPDILTTREAGWGLRVVPWDCWIQVVEVGGFQMLVILLTRGLLAMSGDI